MRDGEADHKNEQAKCHDSEVYRSVKIVSNVLYKPPDYRTHNGKCVGAQKNNNNNDDDNESSNSSATAQQPENIIILQLQPGGWGHNNENPHKGYCARHELRASNEEFRQRRKLQFRLQL